MRDKIRKHITTDSTTTTTSSFHNTHHLLRAKKRLMSALLEEDPDIISSISDRALGGTMAPDYSNGNGHGSLMGRLGKVASSSSIDSIEQETYVSDCPSDDLDKLSMCLSEVSSEPNDGKKSSLFTDIIQAQLALWTLILSIFYSYAWQQHRKKFLISLFVVVPPVVLVCCTMSSLLTAIVILGRVFSTPLRFQDMLKFGAREQDGDARSLSNHYGSSGGGSIRRRRSTSGNSCHSSLSGRSSTEDLLPKPVCRKHSSNHGSSLSLVCGTPVSSPANGFGASLNHNGFHHSSNSGLNDGGGFTQPRHKLSYQYSHYSGGADEFHK